MKRTLVTTVLSFISFLIFECRLFAQDHELSLQAAIATALRNNPDLLASQMELEARQARILQAEAIPNPELQVLTEDFAGSGDFEGLDHSQTTAQLSQRLELGGKRSARRTAASLNRDMGRAELEIKRREITADVRKAFFAVLLSQERMRWMEELLRTAKDFSAVVVERIQAGKIPPIDQIKAESIVAIAEIDLTRSQRELEAARVELASTMGLPNPEFQTVRGELFSAPDVKLEELIQSIAVAVQIERAELEIEESKALLRLEKSKSIPDLTVTGGYRTLQSTDDSAFVAGVSIPLPFFDRNKGGIEEAQKRIQKAEQTKAFVALRLKSSVTKSFQEYSAARSEAESLRTRVLPATQTSFDAISEGYRLGRYGYLDVLEAQRSLFQSRLQLLRALSDIYESAAELERITGKEILQLSDPMEATNE